jgi:phosphate transport system permease protein
MVFAVSLPPSDPEAETTARFLRSARRRDRVAKGVILTGGIGIIAAVAGIFVLIVGVALPLFRSARITPHPQTLTFPDPAALLAAGVDDYGDNLYGLYRSGAVLGFSGDGQARWREQVRAPGGAETNQVVRWERSGQHRHTLLWDNGAASLVEVAFKPEFDATGARTIRHQVKTLLALPPDGTEARRTRLVLTDDGSVRVDWTAAGTFRVVRRVEKEDFLGNKTSAEEVGVVPPGVEGTVTDFVLDHQGTHLYLGTDAGALALYRIDNPAKPELADVHKLAPGLSVRRLQLVFGDQSLAVGDSRGGLSVWMMVRPGPDAPNRVLSQAHRLRGHAAGLREILPSHRSKTLFTLGEDGVAHGDHMTSGRALWAARSAAPARHLGIDGRDARLLSVAENGAATLWDIDCPHPEVSWGTLFGKTWYEGADESAHVWQSSAGTDDYEPKFGLVPLIVGTLKGAFYSLLFAAPLAILGALYVSQFMNPRVRQTIKPAVETMAAVPSVVIGFLAGLWLAPLLEDRLPGVFCMLLVVPAVVVTAIAAVHRLPRLPGMGRMRNGLEFVGLIPVVLLGVALSMYLGGWIETAFLDGDFRQWVFRTFGVRVDQRNSVVIAFALGFTVTPVIFTLADDALSSVPKNLTAASLALGASRWQTAWRVVLPSASPGIFAAVMIGIGRAVGETMIVLMAAGNTPILDFGLFNGMRTLSANIAVEIPEAVHNSTHYRVLFLSGCVLFAFTFTLNTVAETIRIRLRRKYGNY